MAHHDARCSSAPPIDEEIYLYWNSPQEPTAALAYDGDCPLFYPLEPFQFGQTSENSSESHGNPPRPTVPEVRRAEAASPGAAERSEYGPPRCYRRCEGWYCLMTRPDDEPPNHCVKSVRHEGRCLCFDCLYGIDISDEDDRYARLSPDHRALARSSSAGPQVGDGPTEEARYGCAVSSSSTPAYCIHCWGRLAPPSTQCALCFARVHEVCFEPHWRRCGAPVPPPPGPPPTVPPPPPPPPPPPRAGTTSGPAGTAAKAQTPEPSPPAQTGQSQPAATDALSTWIEAGRESPGAYETAALQASLRCAECWEEAAVQQCIVCEVCDSVVHIRCAWPHHLRCRAPTARQRATAGTTDR